jgi:hypothetical protein
VKTAKRKRSQVIENKQSREITDSADVMISMTCDMPCETIRFAGRNGRFVLAVFSLSTGNRNRPGGPLVFGRAFEPVLAKKPQRLGKDAATA